MVIKIKHLRVKILHTKAKTSAINSFFKYLEIQISTFYITNQVFDKGNKNDDFSEYTDYLYCQNVSNLMFFSLACVSHF